MKLLKARVTSKGQVTLPKSLRDDLSIHEGDHIVFAVEAPSHASIRKLPKAGSSAGALKLLAKAKPISVEEMDEAIRQHMRKKYGYLKKSK